MIEKGADYKRVSRNGWNYLHWCGYYGANDCAKYLNQFDELRTPTHLSYEAPDNGNSDTTILYPRNLSAKDIAGINHHMETVKFLE